MTASLASPQSEVVRFGATSDGSATIEEDSVCFRRRSDRGADKLDPSIGNYFPEKWTITTIISLNPRLISRIVRPHPRIYGHDNTLHLGSSRGDPNKRPKR